jgi:hypothetical protein
MYRALLGSIVGLSRTHEAKETDMNDWKPNSMPIVMLRGWAYDESKHPRKTSEPRRTTRHAIRFGTNAVRRLFAASRRTTSREALPHGDRRDLDPG